MREGGVPQDGTEPGFEEGKAMGREGGKGDGDG